MYIRSFLKRLHPGGTPRIRTAQDESRLEPGASGQHKTIDKSEIQSLFQTVLDEKRQDRPVRRKAGCDR